jgi:hypothetical protein
MKKFIVLITAIVFLFTMVVLIQNQPLPVTSDVNNTGIFLNIDQQQPASSSTISADLIATTPDLNLVILLLALIFLTTALFSRRRYFHSKYMAFSPGI